MLDKKLYRLLDSFIAHRYGPFITSDSGPGNYRCSCSLKIYFGGRAFTNPIICFIPLRFFVQVYQITRLLKIKILVEGFRRAGQVYVT